MKKRKCQPKMGTRTKIDLNTLNCFYGTMDVTNTKSFFINLSTWVKIDKNIEDPSLKIDRFKRHLISYIRAKALSLHPDYLYSLVDCDMTDMVRLKSYKSHTYLEFEITILLKKPMKNFKLDKALYNNVVEFSSLVEAKMNEYDDWYSLTKRRIKKQAALILA